MSKDSKGSGRSRDAQPGVAGQRGRAPKKRWWLRRLVVSLAVVIVLVGASPFAAVGLASAGRLTTVDAVASHDVAIVFGAGLDNGEPSPYLAARLEVARALYEAGKAKVILVSGDNLSDYHNEPAAMTTWLVDHGVPKDRIVQDYAGEDTYSTCARALRVFGVDKAILVSQTYHLPRAVATCRLLGVDAVGVGDETMKAAYSGSWRRYQLRELPADVNMAYEVVTNRQPVLGPRESGVDQALGRFRWASGDRAGASATGLGWRWAWCAGCLSCLSLRGAPDPCLSAPRVGRLWFSGSP
ncbi:MAG: YdcF family protein [Propionibacteriaceae bacterium]|jgi:vancomycin permeability regulator SanA|nr:YdcF family protein [Propionibacteriaceae bacterium]